MKKRLILIALLGFVGAFVDAKEESEPKEKQPGWKGRPGRSIRASFAAIRRASKGR